MTRRWIKGLRLTLALALSTAAVSLLPVAASAQSDDMASGPVVYALNTRNELLQFNSTLPGQISTRQAVRGLAQGERLLGIDVRPATGQLYGLSSADRLYTLTLDGQATMVGTAPLTTTVGGAVLGFDFNPVVDRLRVVSANGQNLRLNPNTGTIAGVDGTLAYSSTDQNAGKTPQALAAGYTNNVSGTTTTTLYILDAAQDVLAIQNPPNAGVLNTVGALGLDAEEVAGFDIAPDGQAYAALLARDGIKGAVFASVDLASGRFTPLGRIGRSEEIVGFAIPAGPAMP